MKHLKTLGGCAGLALALAFSAQANATAQDPATPGMSKETKWLGFACDEQDVILSKLRDLAKAIPTNETGTGKLFGKMDVYVNPETKAWFIMGEPRENLADGYPTNIKKAMCIVTMGRNYPWELYDNMDFQNNFKREPLAPAPSDDDEYYCAPQSEFDVEMKKKYGATMMPFKSKEKTDNTYFSEFVVYANPQGDAKGHKAWRLFGVPKDPVTMDYDGEYGEKILCDIDGESRGFPYDLMAMKEFSKMFEVNSIDWSKFGAKALPQTYEPREAPTNLASKRLDYGFTK